MDNTVGRVEWFFIAAAKSCLKALKFGWYPGGCLYEKVGNACRMI